MLAKRAAEAFNPVETAGLKALREAWKADFWRALVERGEISSIDQLRTHAAREKSSLGENIPPEHLEG